MIAILAIISILTVSVFAGNYGDYPGFGNANQQWVMRVVGSDFEGPVVEIQNARSNKCVDNINFSWENKNPIAQLYCQKNAAQKWVRVQVGNYFYLKNIKTRKCIGIQSGSYDNGARLQQWPCRFNIHLWYFNDGRLINKETGKCMDLPGGGYGDVQLTQWHCN